MTKSNAILSNEPLSLYLHIPFCVQRCSYCDFNTYTGLEKLIPTYTQALTKEIEGWGTALGHPQVKTIYFGGGTPSQLSIQQVKAVLSACAHAFRLLPGLEVTLEANPDDITVSYAASLCEARVTRLSMGVQTFDDPLLRQLNRRHSSKQAKEAFLAARRAGVANVNLDFIYGLPGQTLEGWRGTLEQALELVPEHLSLYALTVEEGTALWRQVQSKITTVPDSDIVAEMYEAACEMLATAGYQCYEISNWAHPGYACQHNLTYWRLQPYLGFGPGAHSYLDCYRFSVVESPRHYVQWLLHRPAPGVLQHPISEADLRSLSPLAIVERQRPQDTLSQAMVLGLRLVEEGISLPGLERRFGAGPVRALVPVLEEMESLGLIVWERQDGIARLTPQGVLLSNEVFWRLLPSDEIEERNQPLPLVTKG